MFKRKEKEVKEVVKQSLWERIEECLVISKNGKFASMRDFGRGGYVGAEVIAELNNHKWRLLAFSGSIVGTSYIFEREEAEE